MLGPGVGRDGAIFAGDSSNVPHIPQKRNFSELSSPHLGHLTIVLLEVGVALPHYAVSRRAVQWFKICPVSNSIKVGPKPTASIPAFRDAARMPAFTPPMDHCLPWVRCRQGLGVARAE
jgi:hypothetical protein